MKQQEFAQKIKERYPQYKNMNDTDLVKKVVSKYPTYASQVDGFEKEKTEGVLGKVSRFTGVDALARGIGKVAFGFTKEGKDLDKMLAEGKITPERYQEIATGGLTNKEVIGSAVQTAANFIPGAGRGASLGRKVVTGAATGYAYDVGNSLSNNEQGADVFKPGAGTIVGGVLPIFGKLTGFDKGVANKANKSAQGLEEASLRLTPKDKQLLAKRGNEVVEYLTNKKIVGTPEKRFQKIDALYDAMEDRVSSVIDKSSFSYKKANLISEIQAIPEQFVDDIAGYDDVVKATDRIVSFLQRQAPDEIGGKLLNTYKRQLFKRAYSKNNADVVNETFHAVAELMKNKLDDNVPGLQKINQEYGTLIVARKLLSRAMSRSQAGLVSKTAGMVGGATLGNAVFGPVGSAVGAAVGPVVMGSMSTPVRSFTGATLKTLANTLSKIPTDKTGNLQITRKALLKLLQGIR